MTSLILPSRLVRQPQQGAVIDRGNLLGAKVIEHIALNGNLAVVSGARVTYGASGSTVASTKGLSLRGAGASGRASVPLDLSKYSVITVAFWLYWDGYANDDALAMEFGTTYASVPGFIVDPNCASPAAFMFGSGNASGSNLLTFPRPIAGTWHRILLTMNRGAAVGASGTAYVDGVAQPISMFSGSTATSGNFAIDTLHLLSRNESGLFGTGNLQDVTIYRGALSAAEVAQDYANPWQIFKVPVFSAWSSIGTGQAGNATLIGVSASSAAGTIVGSGSASAPLMGTPASAASGSITATGAASTTLASVSATAGIGTISASGNATATLSGQAATVQVGQITARGAAVGAVTGVQAGTAVGIIAATAGGNAAATILGVSAAASVGTMTASGGATTALSGVQASTVTGMIVASAGGNAVALVTGVESSALIGRIVASGSARTDIQGVSAATIVGAITGSGSARATVPSISVQVYVGTVSASGEVSPDGIARIAGVAAAAMVGQISAQGTRSRIETTVTEDMICAAVRRYILSIAPNLRVICTPANRSSMPNGPYVSFTPGVRRPLSTNVTTGTDNARFVHRPEQITFQIDCYGEGSADLAETLNALYRDPYAVEMFAQSDFEIAPLYAGDVMQAPFVNDADQYEGRYLFQIDLQVNSIIVVPQQSCNILEIDLKSVDANFPPNEVE